MYAFQSAAARLARPVRRHQEPSHHIHCTVARNETSTCAVAGSMAEKHLRVDQALKTGCTLYSKYRRPAVKAGSISTILETAEPVHFPRCQLHRVSTLTLTQYIAYIRRHLHSCIATAFGR